MPDDTSASIFAQRRLASGFGRERRSFSADGFRTTLKDAIPLEPALDLIEADRLLSAPLGHNGQVVEILYELLSLGDHASPSGAEPPRAYVAIIRQAIWFLLGCVAVSLDKPVRRVERAKQPEQRKRVGHVFTVGTA